MNISNLNISSPDINKIYTDNVASITDYMYSFLHIDNYIEKEIFLNQSFTALSARSFRENFWFSRVVYLNRTITCNLKTNVRVVFTSIMIQHLHLVDKNDLQTALQSQRTRKVKSSNLT